MPIYHFHFHDAVAGDLPTGTDQPEGVNFPTKDAAWAEAVRSCASALRDIDGDLPKDKEWRMDVTDEAGKPVFTFRFIGTEHEV